MNACEPPPRFAVGRFGRIGLRLYWTFNKRIGCRILISTLHAGSCKGVFERLLVMVPDHYAVISSVALVLNQRLIRRVCADCRGAGCASCLQTGFRGRAPIVEWFRLDEKLRNELRARGVEIVKPENSLENSARELCEKGITNETECRRIFGN